MAGNDQYTKLLIHGDGDNNSTWSRDEALGHAPVCFGACQLDTSQYKFGSSSLRCDGDQGHLEVPVLFGKDWFLANGAFSIDFWVRFYDLDTSASRFLIGAVGNSDYWYLIKDTNNKIGFTCATGGVTRSSCTTQNAVITATDTWYHIALIRVAANTPTLYVDGVAQTWTGTVQSGNAFTDPVGMPLCIGAYRSSAGVITNGSNAWFDEVRVSIGIVRWDANFDVPTEPYTPDEYDSLLLHFEGATAEANLGVRPYKVFGTAQADTDQAKFGSSSLLLDGNSDFLTFDDSPDWVLGNVFTIDCWVYLTAAPATDTYYMFCCQGVSATTQWYLCYQDAATVKQLRYYNYGPTTLDYKVNTTIGLDAWHHIAVVRESASVTKMYVDGTQVGATSTTNYTYIDSASPLYIGSYYTMAANLLLNGRIDEFRISKGVARWTADFSPSDSAYTWDKYTKLLLHFEAPDGSAIPEQPYPNTLAIDYSMHPLGVYITPSNIAYATTRKKFGTSSLYGAAAYYYATYAESSYRVFGTHNFTIDFWLNLNSAPGANVTSGFCGVGASSTSKWEITYRDVGGTKKLRFHWVNGAATNSLDVEQTLETNQWYHIAVVRQSATDTRLYLDGSQIGATDETNYTIQSIASTFKVGTDYVGTAYARAYIDEFRISYCARWTGNFTPLTEQYKSDQWTVALIHANHSSASSNCRIMCAASAGKNGGYVTFNGNAKIDTSQSVFGGASYVFDGTGDSLSLADHIDYYLNPASDWTIDLWARFNALPAAATRVGTFLSQYVDASNYWYFGLKCKTTDTDWQLQFIEVVGGSIVTNVLETATADYATGTWYHFAVVKYQGVIKLYRDGVYLSSMETNVVGITFDMAASLVIGRSHASDNYALNGWIDEIRLSKGTARWTGNFSTPSLAYNDAASQTYDETLALDVGAAYGLAHEFSMLSEAIFAADSSFGYDPVIVLEREIELLIGASITQEDILSIISALSLNTTGNFDMSVMTQASLALALIILAELNITCSLTLDSSIALDLVAGFNAKISEASRVGYPIEETVHSRSIMQNMVDASSTSVMFDPTYHMLLVLALTTSIEVVSTDYVHGATLALNARAGITVGAT